jgi:hypothetical protein
MTGRGPGPEDGPIRVSVNRVTNITAEGVVSTDSPVFFIQE